MITFFLVCTYFVKIFYRIETLRNRRRLSKIADKNDDEVIGR